jgi:hypothetical protein
MLVLVRALGATCLVVVGVVLGGACGENSVQSLETLSVPADRACRGGEVEPVQVDELIRVFREHELEMFDDPECVGTEEERSASNAPKFGPNPRRADAFDDVMRSQGYVSCDLLASPVRPLQPVKVGKYEGDEETNVVFGNVRCTIYPDDDSEQEQVERLRRAASDLARAVARRQ